MFLYPTTDQEFHKAFAEEKDCIDYIISVRWPEGPKCPICSSDKLWRNHSGLVLECSACGHKVRPLVGTIFQDTKIPLKTWLSMAWYIVTQKFGSNATGLARVLGLAHSTTYHVLHKLRRTMVRAEREKLGPVVEVDEAYYGSPEKGVCGRGAKKKTLIVIAVELAANEKTIGRIRFRVIPDASSDSLIPFIVDNVVPGAKVITDGWTGYLPVTKEGFSHKIKVVKPPNEYLPHVHTVFSLVKRWLIGTYQGGVHHRYLPVYLDEYAFRYNRRKSGSRGKLFRRLIEQAVKTPPIMRRELKVERPKKSKNK